MAASDARPVPQKNVAYRITFPILDADGDLVTGATGLDSEVSKDGGTFADCTSEATEIATASGIYYLDLTSTEMNADTVAIIVKTTSSGAKTTVIVLYPEEAGDIRVNATQWNSLTTVALPLVPTTAGRTLDVSTGGEAGIDWANVGSPTTTVAFTGTTIATTQKVDIETIKTRAVTCAASVTVRADVGAAAAPGAANGMFIAGSNAATTIASLDAGGVEFASFTSTGGVNFDSHVNIGGTITVTGNVDILDGLSITGNVGVIGAVSMANASNNIVGIDVKKISGGATAADNAQSFFDGTGYAGGTTRLKVDLDTIKTNPVVNAGTVTFPTSATLASTTNITAGTITTVATATNVTTVNGLAANVVNASALAADAVAEIQSGLATQTSVNDLPTNAELATALNSVTVVDMNAATANKIADHSRRRTQANVEASANGDALSLNSEYGVIQQAQEANYTTGVVKKTDGTTTLGTLTIATTDDAEPIRGVS